MNYIVELLSEEKIDSVNTTVKDNIINIGESQYHIEEDSTNPGRYLLTENGKTTVLNVKYNYNGKATVSMNGYMYDVSTLKTNEFAHTQMLRESASANQTIVKVSAPMPGLIKEVSVKQGQSVRKGDSLYILEAMKMENIIKSPISGTITSLNITSHEAVEKGTLLCIIEPITA